MQPSKIMHAHSTAERECARLQAKKLKKFRTNCLYQAPNLEAPISGWGRHLHALTAIQ